MNPAEFDIVDTGRPLPEVIDVDYLGKHALYICFSDGKSGKIDLSEWTQTSATSLQDERQFMRFGLQYGTLVWAQNIDISPEYLYRNLSSIP